MKTGLQLQLESSKQHSKPNSPITFPANQPVKGLSIKGGVGSIGWLRFSLYSESTIGAQLHLDIAFKLAPCPWGFALPNSCAENDTVREKTWRQSLACIYIRRPTHARAHAHTHTQPSYSGCNFLCVVLAAAYLKYRRCRLSCLPFVWHFFLCDTHTHTTISEWMLLADHWASMPVWSGAECITVREICHPVLNCISYQLKSHRNNVRRKVPPPPSWPSLSHWIGFPSYYLSRP